MVGILAEYDSRCDAGALKPDAAQRAVAARLDALAVELTAQAPAIGLLARFKKSPPTPKGLYIHGEVGRGKTMLMDLFYETVETAPKRRVHFHAFM